MITRSALTLKAAVVAIAAVLVTGNLTGAAQADFKIPGNFGQLGQKPLGKLTFNGPFNPHLVSNLTLPQQVTMPKQPNFPKVPLLPVKPGQWGNGDNGNAAWGYGAAALAGGMVLGGVAASLAASHSDDDCAVERRIVVDRYGNEHIRRVVVCE